MSFQLVKKYFPFSFLAFFLCVLCLSAIFSPEERAVSATSEKKADYITWVDFQVSCDAMKLAAEYDINTYKQKVHIDWISLLSIAAAKTGDKFDNNTLSIIEETATDLSSGKTSLAALTKDLQYYSYYSEAYTAVLGGMMGEYDIQTGEKDGEPVYETCYGIRCFHPIAKGFPYNDYDDFGASRTYGYNRPHLGHDMMGQIGVPIIAVESGYVEALGWNQYGGWRIGIRSFDKKRYYYYAHLRQNYPFASDLKEGDIVTAGDVIGYMGHTGYSTVENTNNIDEVHLHFGLQLIFDESQKDSDNEIWIDCYELVRFLYSFQCEAEKVPNTKDWQRKLDFRVPEAENYKKRLSS